MAKEFKTWVGVNYQKGFKKNGNIDKVAVIGIHHYCDPGFWACDLKEPSTCLAKRNKSCTAWDKKKDISKQNGRLPSCILATGINDEEEKLRTRFRPTSCEKCELKAAKKLECETLISIAEHINGKEVTKGATWFSDVENIINNLYYETDPNKKNHIYVINKVYKIEIWKSLIFFNYVQHYTKLLNRRDLITKIELNKNKEADKDHFERIIDEYKPSVIIVMIDANKRVYKRVCEIINYEDYCELKNYPIEHCYIFASKESGLYKDYIGEVQLFIEKCASQIKGKQHASIQVRALAEILVELFPRNYPIRKKTYNDIVEKVTDPVAKCKLEGWEKAAKPKFEKVVTDDNAEILKEEYMDKFKQVWEEMNADSDNEDE